MRIRSITVEARETVSLPGYNNLVRGVTLVANINKQDDPAVCYDALSFMADARLREEIDEALEDNGLPPKYFEGERYGVAFSSHQKRVAVLPSRAAHAPLPSGWSWYYGTNGMSTGFREATARRIAEKEAARTGYVVHVESDVRNLPGASSFDPGPEECF